MLYVCLVAVSVLVPGLAGADEITLAWDGNSDQVAGYRLYVGTQSGAYTQQFDVGPATTFTFSNAMAGQQYCFAVTAYTDVLESPRSNEVCGSSNAAPALNNPGNQSSIIGQATSLQLTGADPEGQPLTFGATGLPPGISVGQSTGFISGAPTTAGNYPVTVSASDGVLSSWESFMWAVTSSTTPPPTTPPPTTPPPSSSVTLSAQAFDRSFWDQVRLTWTTASWAQVWVYRNGVRIWQTANDGVFMDSIRRARGTYTYRVCAPNAEACSNDVTVKF